MEDLSSVMIPKNKMQVPPKAEVVDQTEVRSSHVHKVIKSYFETGINEPLTLNMYGCEKYINEVKDLFEKNGFTVSIEKHIVRIE
jgi:hypothetical protein